MAPRRPETQPRHGWLPDDTERMLELREAGFTQAKIARILRTSQKSISRQLQVAKRAAQQDG